MPRNTPHEAAGFQDSEKKVSTRAEAANSERRAKDPLLALICHDLRAPLAAVTMGANFVLQTTPSGPQSMRAVAILEAMLRSCAQMDRLLRNFKDLAEIEENSLELRPGLHDAAEILELAAEAASSALRAMKVRLAVLKPDPRVTFRCDRDRILRAIGHVVENAVQHAPPGSTVTLSASLSEGRVSFAIVDCGPGLSLEELENLDDRHWHATRASRVGAGLGLAIVRGFVLAHEGEMVVDSRPNEITTVTLSFPSEGPSLP